jgi:amino acid transporter
MEQTLTAPEAPLPTEEEPQLKRDAVGMLSSVGIGVAATTPATGVALVFGLMAAGVGVTMPGAILLGFLPILCIASAYRNLNRADPDCGTTFAWATRAFGPYVGWMGGWLIVSSVAVIVTNYAQLLGAYLFLLFSWDSAAASTAAVTVLGCVLFAAITMIAYRGVELSARVQLPLLCIELAVIVGFSLIALVRGVIESPPGSVNPTLEWFNPFAVPSAGALAAGFVSAVLLYWGWDTSAMVNEESEHRERTPGLAAVISTVVLLAFYVIAAVGVLAWAGPDRLAENPEDILGLLGPEVLGGTADHLLVFSVLTSAMAGAIFLPAGGARTLLSMARAGAVPPAFARVHPRYRTPSFATIAFSVVGLAYYVIMTVVSNSVLTDSLSALALLVAGYYGLTGVASAVYFRRRWREGWRARLELIVLPLLGALCLGYVLVKNAIDLADPAASVSGAQFLGVGAPLALAIGITLVGVVLMIAARLSAPAFFRTRAEAAE